MSVSSYDAETSQLLRELADANAKAIDYIAAHRDDGQEPPVEDTPATAPTAGTSPGLSPSTGSSGIGLGQEPVLIGHAVTMILAAAVSYGWVVLPNQTFLMTVLSVIAGAIAFVSGVLARAKVAPITSTWWDVIAGYVADMVRNEVANQVGNQGGGGVTVTSPAAPTYSAGNAVEGGR